MGRRTTTQQDEWYAEGLRFTCTQCGNCCTGPPGYVWFTDEELSAMAAHFELSPDEFLGKYCHKVRGQWSLGEVKVNGKYDCVFLERDAQGRALCSIYGVRPTQCRTWPFWPENLDTPEDYTRASRDCPGMTKGLEGQGDFYPIEQIRIRRDATEH